MPTQEILNSKSAALSKNQASMVDLACRAICEAITSGHVQSGEWLRPERLAKEMGVSHRTVRQALNRAEAEGLAERIPRQGFRAVLLPLEEIEEGHRMRPLLEGLAMEEAAPRITPAELARMPDLLPQTVPNHDSASVQTARQANWEFHWVAISACGRPHLIRTLASLWSFVRTNMLHSQLSAEERIQDVHIDLEDHRSLLEALEASDSARAREVAMAHVSGALRFVKLVGSRGQKGAPEGGPERDAAPVAEPMSRRWHLAARDRRPMPRSAPVPAAAGAIISSAGERRCIERQVPPCSEPFALSVARSPNTRRRK